MCTISFYLEDGPVYYCLQIHKGTEGQRDNGLAQDQVPVVVASQPSWK